jgi:hypothetical protein
MTRVALLDEIGRLRDALEKAEAERDRLAEALRVLSSKDWDSRAGFELAHGEEYRILPTRVFTEIIELQKTACAALERRGK